ncbi:hypothetical protein EDD37DRAFT_629138 [Exophiala viscosa]|uniref:uncharacterized protein n=1 Tax=Exophiala viscosa TaxID=2486360 RepID=UPI002193A29B|nr:hypothetical protein EDD37DRAFT_629138 [Exophiala viscosa]
MSRYRAIGACPSKLVLVLVPCIWFLTCRVCVLDVLPVNPLIAAVPMLVTKRNVDSEIWRSPPATWLPKPWKTGSWLFSGGEIEATFSGPGDFRQCSRLRPAAVRVTLRLP